MFHNILLGLMLVQGLFLIASMVYIATSLHFEDRIVGTNLVGTIVINFIAMLSVYMGEGFGMDIALVYAFLSFLAVVVLCRLLAVQNVEHTIDATSRAKKKAAQAAETHHAEQKRRDEERARREAESEALRRQLEALRGDHKEGEGV